MISARAFKLLKCNIYKSKKKGLYNMGSFVHTCETPESQFLKCKATEHVSDSRLRICHVRALQCRHNYSSRGTEPAEIQVQRIVKHSPPAPFFLRRKTLLLTFRFPFVVKALPQIVQPNGFSPVWVRSCICSALAEEKVFPQD